MNETLNYIGSGLQPAEEIDVKTRNPGQWRKIIFVYQVNVPNFIMNYSLSI